VSQSHPPRRARGPSRRDVVAGAALGAGFAALGCASPSSSPSSSPASEPIQPTRQPTQETPTIMTTQAAPHVLPALPYADTALEPVMSAKTFSFHYAKHHKAYVDNLNNLIKDNAELSSMSLEALVKKVAGDASKAGVFNNAAQVWNHTFFWHSMRPSGGGAPKGRILEKINASFGDLEKFRTAFSDAAKTQFGSGWAWLIEDGGKLAVVKTGNAETPMAQGKKCLLTLDVWEHAYYLDFQNRRPDYIAAYLDKLVNWEFAEKNLG
jgi:Fe-Mn family superoxide dismutase